jgi:DNA-binding response OmpR family regulator
MDMVIAEANPTTADVMAYAAQRRGHQVMKVPHAGRLFGNLPFVPGVVILSVRSPGIEDAESLVRLRAQFPNATLLMVYERPSSTDRVTLMRAGADEILKAPIAPHELILHAESWDRARGTAATQKSALSLADLEVDLNKFAVVKNGISITMTRLELRLLYSLCQHHPHIAPSERLLTFGWEGMEEPDLSLIKTHISHIRKKLREAGGIHLDITSRQGVGYVLSVEDLPTAAAS